MGNRVRAVPTRALGALDFSDRKKNVNARLSAAYGRQLILCTGEPERQLSASPLTENPCFS